MTNAETIRAVYNVFDDTSSELQYCWRVKYMDIGHNETLTDLSFVGSMPGSPRVPSLPPAAPSRSSDRL